MEAIILAGGLGTRLQGVIGQYPKCMADVNGRPFLHYVFDYLAQQGCVRVILSLGFKHEVVTQWVATQNLPFVVDHVIEHEPLGTGGGILLAMQEAVADNVVIVNGDTLFFTDLRGQMQFHLAHHAAATLALCPMQHFDRYGVVNIAEDEKITSFSEKQYREEGLINGGVYIINKVALTHKHLPAKCSFEKDFLERFVSEGNFYGFTADGYFIDIGIPADYEKAQHDFKTMFA